MKILLVNSLNFDEGMRRHEDGSEHLGILYIASSLRRHFIETKLEIKVSYGLSSTLLKEFRPDIVGLSCVSQNYNIAQKYANICKSFGTAVIIGGVHISTLPHTLTKDMDIGVINEGEETVVEIIKVFMKERKFNFERIENIKGIVFHDKDRLVITPPRERIENLDFLPVPSRELYYHPRRNIFTSRGCPYDCVFCFSKPFWGKGPRFFSPEYVVNEMIEMVEKINASHISIADDLFASRISRFKKIVQLIRNAGLHNKVTFNCNIRPNEVTEEIASLLKSMNVIHVFLGIESGNNRVLKYLKKQAATVEQNYNAIRILKKHKIVTYGGIIIGSPDETKEEIMETYNFLRKSKMDAFSPLLLTPLPGTPVWDDAKKRGLVSDDMDWSILREEFNEIPDRHIIMSEVLSRDELYCLYMKFKRLSKRKLIYLGMKHPYLGLRETMRILKRKFHFAKLLFLKSTIKTDTKL